MPNSLHAQSSCRRCAHHEQRRLFTAPAFDGDGSSYDLVECCGCGLVRTAPEPTREVLAHYYASSYYGEGERKFNAPMEHAIRLLTVGRARRILHGLARNPGSTDADAPPRVLDIGCGRGLLLRAFRELGCECHGLERDDFPSVDSGTGIHLHRGPLDDAGFSPGYFDVIVLWHVLEHLDDPFRVLRSCAGLLRPGAMLSVSVPNFDGFQARCFGSHWFALDLPRHLYHFRLATLKSCLDDAGFDVRGFSTWCVDQNVYAFIQSLQNALLPAAGQNRLYELLKSRHAARGPLITWSILAALMAPLALAESALAELCSKGATATVHARRRN
jgi:SAM-dependent methyltransferase